MLGRGGDGFPSQGLPQQPGMVDREVIIAARSVTTQSLSDLESKQVQQPRARPYSPLSLSRSEHIKSGPLSLSYVEKCRKVLWKSPRI